MEAAYGFSITITMLMTTVLLSYFLLYRLKWKKPYVVGLLLLFASIEISFFIANIVKIKERWMFLFFELVIFLVMYVWYYARKVNNRLTNFVDIGKYSQQIAELSADKEIPMFATHLIYLTKANTRHQAEEKIIKSIFDKKPKRSEVYWLLHLNRTEDPYTLNYDVTELLDDKLIKVTINIGFRVQPKTELYFKQIVQDLVNAKELNLHNRPDGSTKYNPEPDFRFVIIEKFLSYENEFALREGLLLTAYFFLKRLGQKDDKAFGIDRHDITIEKAPLIYQPAAPFCLSRIQKIIIQ